jgi:hypothetical protein
MSKKKKEFDRWIFGEGLDGKRQYVFHSQYPRFVAEIFDAADGGNFIGDFDFIDSSPLDATILAALARDAGDALFEYDKILAEDLRQAESEEDDD